ncbi:hypothetical protein SAMN05660816_02345 [Niastella yeongjuensis]|nr:hypothetical protein SAMN05660816_02345 [Niastella yeongjuensis]
MFIKENELFLNKKMESGRAFRPPYYKVDTKSYKIVPTAAVLNDILFLNDEAGYMNKKHLYQNPINSEIVIFGISEKFGYFLKLI